MRNYVARFVLLLTTLTVVACAHPINISPTQTVQRDDSLVIKKNVAYVMSDADRDKQVTTDGGGGDKVTYYPYKDLEKAIRDALKSVYADVVVVRTANDADTLQSNKVAFVFVPELSTSSESTSYFTWPPTKFRIEMNSNVTDANGNFLTRIRVVGIGEAEYSEFKRNHGLSGGRAADDMSNKFVDEIRSNKKLK